MKTGEDAAAIDEVENPPGGKPATNTDLLLDDADRSRTEQLFPSVFHVLDHPQLRDSFRRYDKQANEAKRKGRAAGLAAIFLVFFALILTSTDYALKAYASEGDAPAGVGLQTILHALPFVAAAIGLFGVLLGTRRLLFAGRKERWLHARLMTERIRQFHFQSFVCLTGEISRSIMSDRARHEFVEQRRRRFEDFTADLEDRIDGEFSRMVDPDDKVKVWLFEECERLPLSIEDDRLEPLFKAYDLLRIKKQASYCDDQLATSGARKFWSLKQQSSVLANLGFLFLGLICILHGLVLMSLMIPDELGDPIKVDYVHLVVIWIAFVALALRAVEHGLQPEREIERYQQYRAAVEAIAERFAEARHPSEKLAVMKDMERLSFDEMRNFLLTNDRASFVM